MMDHGERIAWERLAELPEGVYEAQDFMDDDGLSDDPIPVPRKDYDR